MKPGKPESRWGFTLIEVHVSSVVFLVIFMGLATALQSMLVVNHGVGGLGECIDRFKVGMRHLKFGDSPIGGLASATSASIDINGKLSYQCGGPYLLWIQDGELQRGNPLPFPPNPIMGDEADPITILAPGVRLASAGVRLFPDTTAVTPVATVTTAANGSTLVTFTFRLFKDMNGNFFPDEDEPEVTLSPAIFLRNSDL